MANRGIPIDREGRSRGGGWLFSRTHEQWWVQNSERMAGMFPRFLFQLFLLLKRDQNTTNRKSMADVTRGGLVSASMPANATVSGVELDMESFTTIRFGQDKRIDEVARMLCSSLIPPIRMLDRPELKWVVFFYTWIVSLMDFLLS